MPGTEMANQGTGKRQSFVDSREPETIRQPFLRAGWIIKSLNTGDFQFADSVGEVVIVERKTISQLLTDLQSGQLQRQCRRLVEATIFPILILEGHWTQIDGYLLNTRFTWDQIWNALQSLQDIGCRLQLTTSLSHTIKRIFELVDYYKKDYHHSVSRHPSGDMRIATLSLIHGVEILKAKSILTTYPTLYDVANASASELENSCAGIGAKLSERIYRFFHQQGNSPPPLIIPP